jgi:hypothetical protein
VTYRTALSSTLQEIVWRIKALRDYTLKSGFRTTRSEKALLACLDPDGLSAVLLALSCEHGLFRLVETAGAPTKAVCMKCGLVDDRGGAQ